MQINRVQAYTVKNNYNTSFQARFREKDIELILDTVNQSSMRKELIPQVYTMLKFIDEEVPGKLARIDDTKEDAKTIFYFTNIIIDNSTKVIGKFAESFKLNDRIIKALEDACIFKPKNPKNHVRMPQIVFEQEWWKNRKATEQSIRNLSYERQFIKKI